MLTISEDILYVRPEVSVIQLEGQSCILDGSQDIDPGTPGEDDEL